MRMAGQVLVTPLHHWEAQRTPALETADGSLSKRELLLLLAADDLDGVLDRARAGTMPFCADRS